MRTPGPVGVSRHYIWAPRKAPKAFLLSGASQGARDLGKGGSSTFCKRRGSRKHEHVQEVQPGDFFHHREGEVHVQRSGATCSAAPSEKQEIIELKLADASPGLARGKKKRAPFYICVRFLCARM